MDHSPPGDFEILGELQVDGDEEVMGNLTADSNVHIKGDMTLDGEAKGTFTANDMHLKGDLTLDGQIINPGDLKVTGNLLVEGDNSVGGDTAVLGGHSIGKDLVVAGKSEVGDDLSVIGNSTFQKAVTFWAGSKAWNQWFREQDIVFSFSSLGSQVTSAKVETFQMSPWQGHFVIEPSASGGTMANPVIVTASFEGDAGDDDIAQVNATVQSSSWPGSQTTGAWFPLSPGGVAKLIAIRSLSRLH